ncbi:antibiotic biosynthesis monooxygenase [Acidithiobacillus sp. AMEEHan]|uniref:antibiotic biosynthesis monooxygenase n=1 Tax=Acidithiobacillus sp. AMEEHan TaxID=2994951 RepID=UPI0027E50448|nr:antibiotic biosynthesis monooxygenase [Acidithiobacillus sp. AMEEHan]
MDRRRFLLTGAVAGSGVLLSPLGIAGMGQGAQVREYAAFPQSYVVEFRVPPPQQEATVAAVANLVQELSAQKGFLGATLKQMQGESTMVKNYPPVLKGMLAQADVDASKAGRLPYFNVLLLRFAQQELLPRAQLDGWVQNRLTPLLRFTPPGATESAEFLPLTGIYASLIAGDREAIYSTTDAIAGFLARQEDQPSKSWVTVINHVAVPDSVREELEAKVAPLLQVAQNTYEPKDDPNGLGRPGSRDNSDYRKAVSTEILVNTEPNGALRSYLMHGVWESVWDHENSHLDPRFQQSFMAVAPYVVSGPVEPFYHTLYLQNRV